MSQGPLVIISGPSGSGKSTIVARLLATCGLPLRLAVSATTRPPRPSEVDGVHYYFWSRERFQDEVAAGAFLEWAEVYGHLYGTLRREVDDPRSRGYGVILEIDVQGAAQVRQQCPDAVAIFIRTSSLDTYAQRLRQRGTEDPAALQRRLAAVCHELDQAPRYDYQVVNDDLEQAVAQVCDIIRRHWQRRDTHAG
ncbi:MAG: guanylate kinase [Gemmataceae bacterium]|nr:guanylate kinase [Gemmataceae bacterium]MDW8265920.1 guanylate kinase [Gemmataceae bacterium]